MNKELPKVYRDSLARVKEAKRRAAERMKQQQTRPGQPKSSPMK